MRTKHDNLAFISKKSVALHERGRVPQASRELPRPAPVVEGHIGAQASHPEFPLERICSYMSEPFQLTFARNAQQHFVTREDVEVLSSHQGLTIRAETEEAIDAALVLLEDLYGPRLRISPPSVRYHQGVTLEQPWMGLRIRCDTVHLEAVNADLLDRDATIISCDVVGAESLVQARAPLASVLGYKAALEKIAGASAKHAIWLSHYAPVEPPPPGGKAA